MIAANKTKNLWKYYDLSVITPLKITSLLFLATTQDIRSNIPDIAGLTEKEYNEF
jgi:hypothetical protein